MAPNVPMSWSLIDSRFRYNAKTVRELPIIVVSGEDLAMVLLVPGADVALDALSVVFPPQTGTIYPEETWESRTPPILDVPIDSKSR